MKRPQKDHFLLTLILFFNLATTTVLLLRATSILYLKIDLFVFFRHQFRLTEKEKEKENSFFIVRKKYDVEVILLRKKSLLLALTRGFEMVEKSEWLTKSFKKLWKVRKPLFYYCRLLSFKLQPVKIYKWV